MRTVVLSSGSRGNTTYVEYAGTKILIDLGNTCKYVVEKLKELGIDGQEIDAILITHTHVDHIKGLKVFASKFKTKVYFPVKLREELSYIENYELIETSEFMVGKMMVSVIRTSHDALYSVGYVVEAGESSLVYITDTGYINQKYFPLLKNRDVYIMESNHDIEMLNHSSYSFALRKRILGDKGHLSNYDCSRYLSNFIGSKTKYIVLAHLSQENNTPEIAYETLMSRLNEDGKRVQKVLVAKQDEESEEIVL